MLLESRELILSLRGCFGGNINSGHLVGAYCAPGSVLGALFTCVISCSHPGRQILLLAPLYVGEN